MVGKANWACAHNCTEPPYHRLLDHHFSPRQCHHIQFRVTCNRIITEWVQAFTLPGMKKRVVLHHLKSATNWMKSYICFQQHTSKSLNQYLWIYLGSPALLRYFENQCHFNCTQLFSYSWSSFSMLRFLVIRLWCAATRSSCIENHWTQYKKLIK